MNQRVANFRGALHASLARAGGLGGIKRLAGDGIGKLCKGAAIVHFSLRSFRLELVQDAGQLGDLLLVQVKLVRQKTQGSSDAKSGPSFEAISLFMMMTVARHEPSSRLTMFVVMVVFVSFGFVAGMK